MKEVVLETIRKEFKDTKKGPGRPKSGPSAKQLYRQQKLVDLKKIMALKTISDDYGFSTTNETIYE